MFFGCDAVRSSSGNTDEQDCKEKWLAAEMEVLRLREALEKISEEIPNPTLPVTKIIKEIVFDALNH